MVTKEMLDVLFKDEELLKQVAKEYGYYIYKRPDSLVELRPCVCGFVPTRRLSNYRSFYYHCPNCNRKAPKAVDKDRSKTRHQLNQEARMLWNEFIFNERKTFLDTTRGLFKEMEE